MALIVNSFQSRLTHSKCCPVSCGPTWLRGSGATVTTPANSCMSLLWETWWVAQAGRMETYKCWSEEEGFRQLLANYCLIAEPHQESTTLRAHSRTPRFEHEESIILPGESHSEQVYTKTYWNELIVVCGLLAFSFVVFSLFVLCRNQDHMKSMLKQGECTPSMQQEAKDCGKAHRELSP